MIDYFDHMEKQIQLHLIHRNIVSSEHRSKKDYEINSRPWSVQNDMDFSENGAIEIFDKAQSEHWQTQQYTLFMSICTCLMSDKLNKVSGKLDKYDEVTVYGKFYIKGQPRPNINQDYYWTVVTGHICGDLYRLEDKEGGVFEVERIRTRLRKRHVVCCAHVSNEKKHDRFAMQHFSTAELEWLEEYMKE